MNEFNDPANKELAERLWNQQGRHEDHSREEWLEAEYRAHPPMAAVQNEVDLRMRGLGPLTRNDLVKPPMPIPFPKTNSPAVSSLWIVAGVCVGAAILYSIVRKIFA